MKKSKKYLRMPTSKNYHMYMKKVKKLMVLRREECILDSKDSYSNQEY